MRLLLALLFALPAAANVTTGAITGRVQINGAPAPGVTITLSSRALQAPRGGVTNAHGRYWIDTLPPGVYDVTFSLAAHTTVTKRAVLEIARVARADATLEPNTDEDSTTSTAITLSVADTISITTHFDDQSLDRLPTGRQGSASLAPGGQFGWIGVVDNVPSGGAASADTIEQITVVRGATPVEWESFAGGVIAARTRSGGEDLFFTLRDTITNTGWISEPQTPSLPAQDDGLLHFGEATAGGRIVPQQLWFFASIWHGEEATPGARAYDGFLAKLDAQLAPAHHLSARYGDATQSFGVLEHASDVLSLDYTGVAGTRFTSDVVAARREAGSSDFLQSSDFLSARGSTIVGDHVVTAGFTSEDGNGAQSLSFYASDRWSFSNWNVYAGLRHDDAPDSDRWSPRVAVTYDLRGNGSQAISASWGDYAETAYPPNADRLMTLGYAIALGSSGNARADVVRRKSGAVRQNELQVDARYRLFDRFEAGATYFLANRYQDNLPLLAYLKQKASVWLGAELPAGDHEFGATLLQHYAETGSANSYPTDVALRYAIPFSRVGLLIAADATNVFLQGDPPFGTPRAVRLWLRVRL